MSVNDRTEETERKRERERDRQRVKELLGEGVYGFLITDQEV